MLHPGERERRQLPFYTDFVRGGGEPLWCDVIGMSRPLNLYWRYTDAQVADAVRWECPGVWLHSAAHDNGSVYSAQLYVDLGEAVYQLARRKSDEAVRFSLLVNPDGMVYDANRLGGDYLFTTSSGRHFTFSVRRDRAQRKLLLAIAWN